MLCLTWECGRRCGCEQFENDKGNKLIERGIYNKIIDKNNLILERSH